MFPDIVLAKAPCIIPDYPQNVLQRLAEMLYKVRYTFFSRVLLVI